VAREQGFVAAWGAQVTLGFACDIGKSAVTPLTEADE